MDRHAHLGAGLNHRIAIIGAGWSGLACAVELTRAGAQVCVFEASRTLGGRAREVAVNGASLDNGQHILLGAYTDTLALMSEVGIKESDVLLRVPLTVDFPGEMQLAAPRLPGPLAQLWALLAARGLSVSEKWAACRFMRRLDDAVPGETVAASLARARQPQRVIALFWEPLCLGALNTPIEAACAKVFCKVLKDSLGAHARAADMLLPRTDLSRAFPSAAATWIEGRGGKIYPASRVRGLNRCAAKWQVQIEGASADALFDQVVIATAPHHAAKLLTDLPEAHEACARIAAFSYQPITTCYLQYPPQLRLQKPMLGVARGTAQWLFDRGQLCGQAGLISAVISASARLEALVEGVMQDVARLSGTREAPLWHQVITEKRATFSCTPQARRPSLRSGASGLWLAGDYLDPDYPATLETAVRTARRVAREIVSLTPATGPNPGAARR